MFKKEWLNISPYPANVIPPEGEIFRACDLSENSGIGCEIKGFFDEKTGEIHIQEVMYSHNKMRYL